MSAYEGSKWQEENERRKANIQNIQQRVTKRVNKIVKEVDKDYYPSIQYQRLFNAIHETGGIALESEMQEIIKIVHEDFPGDGGQQEKEGEDKYSNLSADCPCPDCNKLRDENGSCDCMPTPSIEQCIAKAKILDTSTGGKGRFIFDRNEIEQLILFCQGR